MKKIYSAWMLLLLFCTPFATTLHAQDCWSPLSAAPGHANGIDGITAMTTFNGNLIAGGFFTSAGGQPVNNIAMWNGTTWSAMGQGINASLNGGYYIAINTLAVYNNELYAGGSFDSAGTTRVNGIAKWDGTSWTAVGGGLTGYISGIDTSSPSVTCLAVYNGALYAAGAFYAAGGAVVNNIAKWDGTAWSAVGAGIGTGTGSAIYSLVASNGLLYAGGGFLNASGLAVQNVASWNGTTWAALGSGIGPDTLGQGGVIAMTTYQGNILAGLVIESGAQQVFSISQWNGTTWQSFLGGPGTGIYYPGVLQNLYAFNNDLIVEGSFDSIANVEAPQGIALWNGTGWSNFSVDNDTALYNVATSYNNHLYIGGYYIATGTAPNLNVAEYTCQTTSAVNNVTANNLVHVYPNPTAGPVNFELDNTGAQSAIQIYDLLGTRIYNGMLNPGKNEIDLTGAARGVYLYRIAASSGEVAATGSLVVQ